MIKIAKENKKVRNATPITYNDIKFKSKLEAYTYKIFAEAGIILEYEVERFTLVDKFRYKDENIRAITYKPDFIQKEYNFIIECKGYGNESFPLRWKLFKRHLYRTNNEVDIYIVKTQKDAKKLLEYILNKIKKNDKGDIN